MEPDLTSESCRKRCRLNLPHKRGTQPLRSATCLQSPRDPPIGMIEIHLHISYFANLLSPCREIHFHFVFVLFFVGYHKYNFYVQGGSLNWPPLKISPDWPPPINPSTGPPLNLLRMRITKHLDFFRSLGGASLGL